MTRKMIPVVYGGADYSSIAPPHSYIDARLFEPQELANYLSMLDANETLYNEYFWWKDNYVEAGPEQMVKRGFCELCKKLHLKVDKVARFTIKSSIIGYQKFNARNLKHTAISIRSRSGLSCALDYGC